MKQINNFDGWYCQNDKTYFSDGHCGVIVRNTRLEGPQNDGYDAVTARRVALSFEDQLGMGEVALEKEIKVSELRKTMAEAKRTAKNRRNDLLGVALDGEWLNFAEGTRSSWDAELIFQPDKLLKVLKGIKGTVKVTIRFMPSSRGIPAWYHLLIEQDNMTAFVCGMHYQPGKFELHVK